MGLAFGVALLERVALAFVDLWRLRFGDVFGDSRGGVLVKHARKEISRFFCDL